MVGVGGEIDRGDELTKSDPEAFESLYRTEYSCMVRLAFVLRGSGEAAEDVVQDAFALFHAERESVDNPGGLSAGSRSSICAGTGKDGGGRIADLTLDSGVHRCHRWAHPR